MGDADQKPLAARRSRRVRWLVLTVALLAGAIASCKSTLKPLPPADKRTYQSLLEWSHSAGMPGAILLVQTPRTQFLGTVGNADLASKTPMQSNDVFQIGSVTKMPRAN